MKLNRKLIKPWLKRDIFKLLKGIIKDVVSSDTYIYFIILIVSDILFDMLLYQLSPQNTFCFKIKEFWYLSDEIFKLIIVDDFPVDKVIDKLNVLKEEFNKVLNDTFLVLSWYLL